MKERLVGLVKTYLLLVCMFVVQKPLFMLCCHTLYDGCGWLDWLKVMWHGLALDFSLAGYLAVVPGLLFVASVWTLSRTLHRIWCTYFVLVSLLLSLIFVVDVALYEYWGSRLDAASLFYFFSSPKNAVASVSLWMVALGIVIMLAYGALLYGIFYVFLLRKEYLLRMKLPYQRLSVSGGLLLATGLLFIPIRGGFAASSMNAGKVYFSDEQRLNHAAINPAFSLIESLAKQADFGAQYRFMEAGEAVRLFEGMLDPSVRMGRKASGTDSLQVLPSNTLFTTQRPDVLFIILGNFSSQLMASLGGEDNIAVHLDSLAREGVLFTNFYANSCRTDGGLVAILSGYPAQPTAGLLKYPRKMPSVPSIAGSLRAAGYKASYYYGGDADSANMRSYLESSGFEKIVADRDFPVSDRLSKWGVPDHLLFRCLLDDLKAEVADSSASASPRFRVLQTSSSHEPFEVPYRRLADDRANSFAYTDSCVGDFIRQYRALPQWKNTVVVLVPDHQGAHPAGLDNLSVERYQIPLLWVGGAIRKPQRLDVYGSQQDIAATLLAQLGLPHGKFTFSKDLLNPSAPHFAFFTMPDAFGMVTPDNQLIFDCRADRVAVDAGTVKSKNLQAGKAYLQQLYDDIAEQ